MRSNWNLSCFLILSCCLISSNVQANIRCGVANPNQVDKITLAIVRRSTVSEIIVDWLQPSTVPELWDFHYVLSCPGCTGHEQQITTSGTTYKFSGLIPAMEYVVSLQAGHRDCELSPSYVLNAKTALSNLPEPLHFSDIDETSFRVHWVPSPDVGIRYEVSCAGIVDGDSVLCRNLQSGASIDVTVRTVKPGFPQSSYVRGTALTKLFPIDANEVQYAVYESGITVSWSESNTPAVTYALTCSRVGTNSDVTVVKSTVPTATCKNLHTGLEYNLSVIVQKPGGFEDTRKQQGPTRTRVHAHQWIGSCLKASATFWSRDPTDETSRRPCLTVRDETRLLTCSGSRLKPRWTGMMDFSERNWRLREDYRAQCRDCRNLGDAAWTGLYRDEADGGNFKWLIDNSNLDVTVFQGDAAWTGLYRDEADGGNFKWLIDNSNVDVTVNWFVLEPGNPPRNYGYIYETVSSLYFRTYSPEAKHYHFCKAPVFVSTTAPLRTPTSTSIPKTESTTLITSESTAQTGASSSPSVTTSAATLTDYTTESSINTKYSKSTTYTKLTESTIEATQSQSTPDTTPTESTIEAFT
uniref:Fibronectin type-III domain-containing protein n=1 Tax=Macrostomum lignano TaxID=282301 RepID=A0A1I8HJF7_9PLAT